MQGYRLPDAFICIYGIDIGIRPEARSREGVIPNHPRCIVKYLGPHIRESGLSCWRRRGFRRANLDLLTLNPNHFKKSQLGAPISCEKVNE